MIITFHVPIIDHGVCPKLEAIQGMDKYESTEWLSAKKRGIEHICHSFTIPFC
jgi:hypothetical protein